MEHLLAEGMPISNTHPGNGSSVNISMIVLSWKLDLKTGGIGGAAGTAKDDGIIVYKCGQADHISHNCPNCNLRNKQLNQVLVGKDTLKARYGCQCKDKKMGHVPPCQKKRGQLADQLEGK